MTTSLKTVVLILAVAALALPALAQEPKPAPAEAKERLDSFGDPLPAGALARFGTLRWRHSAPVFFLAYTSDDKEMVTVSQDGQVRIWEVASGKELRKFGRAAQAPVNGGVQVINGAVMAMPAQQLTGATLTSDRKTLAISGTDGTIRLWNVADGTELRNFKPNPQVYVGGMIFSPDGKMLAVKSNDQMLRLYNVEDGKEIRKLGEQPNGARRIFFGGNPGSSMAFTPDGKSLLSGAMEFENNMVAAIIKTYNVEDGKEKATIKGPQGGFQSLALAPDGKTVAWGGNDGVLRLWDIAANKEKHQMGGPQSGGYANALAFSPDGKSLVTRSYDQVIRVWDTDKGKELRQLGGQEIQNPNGVVRAFGYGTSNLSFSSDGKHVAAGTGGNSVRQWEVETGKESAQSGGHHGPVVTLGVSPDGKTAITRAGDNTVHIWDVATGKETRHFRLPENVMHVFLSADGKTMVLGDYQGTLRTWNALEGKEIKEWKVSQNQNPAFGGFVGLASLAISPDGKTVAARTYDQSIRLYEAASGRELKVVAEAPQPNPNGGVAVGFVNYGQPGPMMFSPDGAILASLSNGGQMAFRGKGMPNQMASSVQLWDVATGKPLRKVDTTNRAVICMAFSPDGRSIATGNADNTVSLWEVASAKERVNFKSNAANGLTVITYAPDGRSIVGAGYDNTVRFYGIASGKELSQLKGHEGGVVALAMAGDGKTLLSGSVDTTALIFDVGGMARDAKAEPANVGDAFLEALWHDLTSEDAKKAYEALQSFSNAKQTATFLQERVKAIPAPDPTRVAKLIADLEGEKPFTVRQRATEELEKLGELAADALKKVLDDKPGLEMQMRIERLLERLVTGQAPPAEQLRAMRALELLETLNTPEARATVQTVSKGAAGARLTKDAHATLNRMAK